MGNPAEVYGQVVGELPKHIHVRKEGNIISKPVTWLGGAISKTGDIINMVPIPVVTGLLASSLNATGATVKAVGDLTAGDLRSAGNDFVGGHIAAKTRAVASFIPLATTVDGLNRRVQETRLWRIRPGAGQIDR